MKKSTLGPLRSRAAWRGWLKALQRWLEAVDFSDRDHLERRIDSLERQVSDLRSKPGIAGSACRHDLPDAG